MYESKGFFCPQCGERLGEKSCQTDENGKVFCLACGGCLNDVDDVVY